MMRKDLAGAAVAGDTDERGSSIQTSPSGEILPIASGVLRPLRDAEPGRRLLALLVGALMAAPLPAGAGGGRSTPPDLTNLSLEQLLDVEVVVAASRREQRQREAPSSVAIVTAAEIRRHGYRTLADVLRSLRGFYVTDDRNYAYVGVRGFGRSGDYNTRILLLLDGQRTNENVYDASFAEAGFPVDLELVERIEVIRGPSASLYGNSAFFAVINVVTKQGGQIEGGELAAEAGSFGTYRGRAAWGRRLASGLEALASASLSETEGQRLYFPEFDGQGSHGGIADGLDGEDVRRLFASLQYRGFSLRAVHGSRGKGVPTASFETVFGDRRNRTTDALTLLSAGYERASRGSDGFLARLQYGHYEYRGSYVYAGDEGTADVVNRDGATGDWWSAEVAATLLLGERHATTVGAEFHDNLKQRQFNYDESPRHTYLDLQQRSARWGVYVQDEFKIHERVRASLGVRHDRYETFGHSTNPRLAVLVEPDRRTTVKLLHGRAFRAPNEYELHYSGVQFAASPDLRPETIDATELVVERLLGRNLRLTASVFKNRLRNLIVQHASEEDGLLRFANTGRIDSSGLELSLEAKGRRAQARLNYSFQDTRDAEDGSRLPNSPRHLAKGQLTVPLAAGRVSGGLNVQYMSPRRTLSGGEVPAFATASLTLLAERLRQGLDVSASLYNLFDTSYADPASEEHRQDAISQDGRSLRLQLTWRF